MFDHVPAYPGDPILSLVEAFQRDPHPDKASLGIGVYLDDAGRLPAMQAVREAERAILSDPAAHPYLPMEGSAAYRQAAQKLAFGAGHEAVRAGRVATIQTLGGSGALKVGGDFLRRYFNASGVWVSDPTWDNHRALFEGAGFEVQTYPYYDAATGGLRFEDMLTALAALPERSIVLLHASCHNPTGVDLAPAQWDALALLFRERRLIAFIDMAYQGFGDGLDEDAYAVRRFAEAGLPLFVAASFSKNFSLYGERCGALSVACPDADQAGRVLGQLQACVRANYSSPPAHGSRIVARVLESPELSKQWSAELTAMRARIKDMRRRLHAALTRRFGASRDFGYLLAQRGMFSYTGLDPQQVERLRDEHGVYLVRSGRMCMSGLTTKNVEHVARAVAAVLESTEGATAS